jgi:hypothetical protein
LGFFKRIRITPSSCQVSSGNPKIRTDCGKSNWRGVSICIKQQINKYMLIAIIIY